MLPECQAGMIMVLDEVVAVGHLPELNFRLLLLGNRPRLTFWRGDEERQRLVA
jgi:hypothetical protein